MKKAHCQYLNLLSRSVSVRCADTVVLVPGDDSARLGRPSKAAAPGRRAPASLTTPRRRFVLGNVASLVMRGWIAGALPVAGPLDHRVRSIRSALLAPGNAAPAWSGARRWPVDLPEPRRHRDAGKERLPERRTIPLAGTAESHGGPASPARTRPTIAGLSRWSGRRCVPLEAPSLTAGSGTLSGSVRFGRSQVIVLL